MRAKKRRSGHGRNAGNEVTSGFDRHRIMTDESDENSDDSDAPKRANPENTRELATLRKELEKKNKSLEDAKKEVNSMKEQQRLEQDRRRFL